MGNIINQLVEIINTLNRIEVKGFENLMNLGLSIQELNKILQTLTKDEQ
jgi:hypothetical protein